MENVTQKVFAGDGDDIIDLGDNWFDTFGYGGSGDDTFNLPVNGEEMYVFGGEGNDIMTTDRGTEGSLAYG